MKRFKEDPSFINKYHRRCDFVEVNVSEYLDDLAITDANKCIEMLHNTPDNEVKYGQGHVYVSRHSRFNVRQL